MYFVGEEGASGVKHPTLINLVSLSVWSFDRKTYTWSSPKSSHSWNPVEFTMKSGGFHHKIWQISWNLWNPVDFRWNLTDFRWNLVDFMKSGRFQVKSTPNLIKSDVSTKTLQFGGCMEGGYDPRFHEIQGHSPSPAFIKLNSFCWNIWFYKVWGGFHLKSAGFHVKSKDHLQGIVTLCFRPLMSVLQKME